jgi:hypothetical protein
MDGPRRGVGDQRCEGSHAQGPVGMDEGKNSELREGKSGELGEGENGGRDKQNDFDQRY